MSHAQPQTPFWQEKRLVDMSMEQWEALCDGCGKCCLVQLEDEDSGQRCFTDLACKYFNIEQGGCTAYEQRSQKMPTCVKLTPQNLAEVYWLPMTCAYRLINEGKQLPAWHPLLTGNKKSVAESGHAMAGRVIPILAVDEENWEDHIVDWVG